MKRELRRQKDEYVRECIKKDICRADATERWRMEQEERMEFRTDRGQLRYRCLLPKLYEVLPNARTVVNNMITKPWAGPPPVAFSRRVDRGINVVSAVTLLIR